MQMTLAAATTSASELSRLSTALEGALAPLRAALAGHSAIAAGVAHELRQLELVRTQTHTLLRGVRSAIDEEAAAEQVRASLARVRRLTDCLEHMRPAVANALAPVNLSERAERRLALLAPQIKARDLTITSHVSQALAQGEGALLSRAVDEVVDNAVQHNLVGGWIELSTDTLGNRAVLRIANSGPVIDPATVGALTEPFRSFGHAGLGLGLALVSRIVEGHGGTLWITAPPSGGLSAELELPGESSKSLRASGRRLRGDPAMCDKP
ncbi:MAG: hypothetical protein NVSMB51_17510 [Solirubrobacteraceae bacterium]